jgi:hypothetical protein
MRVEWYEETDDEPSSAVNEEPPNMDFFSVDDIEDGTVISDNLEDDLAPINQDDLEDGQTSIDHDDDLLPDTHLQKEFFTTQIVFGHKRIKDYVVESDFRFSDADPLAVGVDINKAEVEITLTLLTIICDGITKKFGEFNLVSYAAENFMKHLASIDISRTNDSDKQKILKLLFRAFNEKDTIRLLLYGPRLWFYGNTYQEFGSVFLDTWTTTSKYTEVVRQWFREVEEVEETDFESSTLEWIQKASLSAKELLRPLALVSANLWLSGNVAFDDDYEFRSPLLCFFLVLLNNYLSLVSHYNL